MSLYDDIEREAVHDWLDERRDVAAERPDPADYEDDGLDFRCPQCGTDDHDWWDHPL